MLATESWLPDAPTRHCSALKSFAPNLSLQG
jgi:hypothetical protein